LNYWLTLRSLDWVDLIFAALQQIALEHFSQKWPDLRNFMIH
jgi:hypothetical protein